MPAMLRANYCVPTAAQAVRTGPDWFHEIKYDGFRLRPERSGKAVRLITSLGSWEQHFAIDGEHAVERLARASRERHLCAALEDGHRDLRTDVCS